VWDAIPIYGNRMIRHRGFTVVRWWDYRMGRGRRIRWGCEAGVNRLVGGIAQYPDKYFVVVTGPATPAEYDPHRENARAIAEWMRNEWLEGYEGDNVVVYDLYNVLTSNAEGEGDACRRTRTIRT